MVVAATKLLIPTTRRPVVARPHLHARLDGDYRVALVSAPAGYGKTAALAVWASEQCGQVAWLSCDALDVEPTRFMSCLLATISATWPGVADDAIVLLEREGADTYDPAVAAANALAALDAPGVIIVDDLHLAPPAPTMLAAFIEALPPRFRFVAGTTALRARLALLDGDRRGAASLLADAPLGRSRRERVERSVLMALSVGDRDVDLANEHLSAALAAARPERLVRAVLEAGPQVHRLLASCTPRGDEHEHVASLVAASSRDVAPVRVPTLQPLVDPLSTRELTVLRYLSSRLTYQEIAGALFISLNTLKSHVRAVYCKLGVASRSDAIGTGRHLGLI